MKLLLRFVIALVLTGPVFFGLSRVDPLARWAGSEAAWSTLAPLFRLFGAVGTEGEETILLGVLFVVSFIIAAAIVWGSSAVLTRMRTHRAVTH
ncbi:MAG TPA: hypothetical protein VF446_16890 [Trinickia sp.]